MKRIVTLFLAVLAASAVAAQDMVSTDTGTVRVDRMAGDLDQPWALTFLSGGAFAITERDGQIKLFRKGQMQRVTGVPKVAAKGQGGLLDLVAARDFATTGEVFLTYSEPVRGGARTSLAVARLDIDGAQLTNLRVIFGMSTASGSGRHFGSRVVEARDGTLFLTIGDRGDRPSAQDLNQHSGKVIRVNRDGSIPSDNPFAKGGARPEIWSIGHRNPQGAALDETGRFWTVAHGAKGGDEINTPEAGKNYGWPVISYGQHYRGGQIGEGTAKAGLEQPRFYWDPSIAPSGMMIYTGNLFPQWKGDIFVGSLKFDMISRLDRRGNTVTEVERLFQNRYYRIRDIRQAPDGSIWFLSVGDGAAYRITPA